MKPDLNRRLLSEFLGTAGLLVTVVGSGIMGETLAQGNAALALLANSLATGAGLYALIQAFEGVSGAHFNPVVSLVDWISKKLTTQEWLSYVAAQVLGAISGVLLTHIIFGQAVFQLSNHHRAELRLAVSEVLATLGLILVIGLTGKKKPDTTPAAVACYIVAAYWATSSTSFANPAVTLARSLTDTFSGIHWAGVPAFVLAQVVGAGLGFLLLRGLKKDRAG
ncbi:MAG: aquaporin [Bdellovibrionales bacterium]|nr:aquaporin [Bdellovibrionales bacterium]